MTIFIIIIFLGFLLFSYYGLPENKSNHKVFNDYNEKNTSTNKFSLMPEADSIFLKGSSDTAFLMIHGYEGSPFSVKSAAEACHKLGHSVFAPLLPGHGTREEDFIKTRYLDWYNAVRNIYVKERKNFKYFFILGTSTGGNLLMKLNIEYSKYNTPTGIILLSAPVTLAGFLNSSLVLKDWRILLSGFIQYIVPHIKKKPENEEATKLSPWVGYRKKISTPCVHSIKINFPKVKKKLHFIKNPALLIQATNDRTIHFENLHYIFRKIGSQNKRAFMFQINDDITSRHLLLTHQETKKNVIKKIEDFVADVLFDEKNKKNFVVKKGFWKKLWHKIMH